MKIQYPKYYILFILLFRLLSPNNAYGQKINPDSLILKVKQKLELIKDYKADIEIHLDVDFIKMPDKHAKMFFKQPYKVRFISDEFIMLPKRGIGVSTRNVLKDDYLALFSGEERINGKVHAIVKIIPEGNKSDLVLSTLWINTENALVSKVENTTRNNGSYLIYLGYSDPGVELPTEIKISFRVKNLKIPLKFIGKNSTVDKDKLKMDGNKEGSVSIKLRYFDINKGIEDSFFEEENNPD